MGSSSERRLRTTMLTAAQPSSAQMLLGERYHLVGNPCALMRGIDRQHSQVAALAAHFNVHAAK